MRAKLYNDMIGALDRHARLARPDAPPAAHMTQGQVDDMMQDAAIRRLLAQSDRDRWMADTFSQWAPEQISRYFSY